MKNKILIINKLDNVAVALDDLKANNQMKIGSQLIVLKSNVQAKHKFTLKDIKVDEEIYMYGVIVGKATKNINQGEVITTQNVKHTKSEIRAKSISYKWTPPNISNLEQLGFKGFVRKDGQVGTRNIWLFFPLVFCENKNIEILKDIYDSQLLKPQYHNHKTLLNNLINKKTNPDYISNNNTNGLNIVFENIEVKFLTHQGGCGSTREEAEDTAKLLAGYVNNPNVAGASILSLGCQNLQEEILLKQINNINQEFDKPLLFFNHQEIGNTDVYLNRIISESFIQIEKANQFSRKFVPLSKLKIGLECGGSDGFSGITANPLLGIISDKIVAAGGSVILGEFPELCGVEQEIIDRCIDNKDAETFLFLMKKYEEKAINDGSGFDMNPSPGNIKDGLITDAMKSAGAAKKAGSSPIVAVKDYGEYIHKQGLSLLCTPGNDVVSTTALVGSGANLILFTTGLGTPTGNPISPVVKIASNSSLAIKMKDIIDFDAGSIITGIVTLDSLSDKLLNLIINVASGITSTKSIDNRQDDFITWQRRVSL